MENQKKAKKSDLKWFSIDNYSFINELTLSELVDEIELRGYLHYLIDINDADDVDDIDQEYDIKYERIFSGDPHLHNLNNEEKEIAGFIEHVNSTSPSLFNLYGELPSLKGGMGVRPVTFSDLCLYDYTATKQGFFQKDDDGINIKANAMLSSVSGNLEKLLTNTVLLSIDLEGAADEEIVSSIKNLLPTWRRHLVVPESDHVSSKRMGVKTLQKLILHRVLPIIDLLIWEKKTNKLLPNPMIGHLVFNDDPRDTQSIKETVKPFALEAISDQYIRLIRLHINKDGEIGSAKVSDILSRIS